MRMRWGFRQPRPGEEVIYTDPLGRSFLARVDRIHINQVGGISKVELRGSEQSGSWYLELDYYDFCRGCLFEAEQERIV